MLEKGLSKLISGLFVTTLCLGSFLVNADETASSVSNQYWFGKLTSGKAYSGGEAGSLFVAWRPVNGEYFIASTTLVGSDLTSEGMRVIDDKVISYPKSIGLGNAQIVQAGTVLSVNAQRKSKPCYESEGYFAQESVCDASPDMLLGDLTQLSTSTAPDIRLPFKYLDNRGYETRISENGVIALCDSVICAEIGNFDKEVLSDGTTEFIDNEGFIHLSNSSIGCLAIIVRGLDEKSPPLITALNFECGSES